LLLEARSRSMRSPDGQVRPDPAVDLPPAQVVVKSMPPWTNGGWAQAWTAPSTLAPLEFRPFLSSLRPFMRPPGDDEMQQHLVTQHAKDPEHVSAEFMTSQYRRRFHDLEHRHVQSVTHQHDDHLGTPGEDRWSDAYDIPGEYNPWGPERVDAPWRDLSEPGKLKSFRPIPPSLSSLRPFLSRLVTADDDQSTPEEESAQVQDLSDLKQALAVLRAAGEPEADIALLMTAAGIEEPARRAGGFYHGTAHEFAPGEHVAPGHDPRWHDSEPDSAYFTSSPLIADFYSTKGEHGHGHVYEVHPEGDYEEDPHPDGNLESSDRNYRARGPLRVLREIPPHELDAEWARFRSDPLSYEAALRAGLMHAEAASEGCMCCQGKGEHSTGHECYRCDGSGYVQGAEIGSPSCEEIYRDPDLHDQGGCPCGWKSDTSEDFQDRGEPYRQQAGIDGTAGDAMDKPHPFTPDTGFDDSRCVTCGLGRHQAALRHSWVPEGDGNREKSCAGCGIRAVRHGHGAGSQWAYSIGGQHESFARSTPPCGPEAQEFLYGTPASPESAQRGLGWLDRIGGEASLHEAAANDPWGDNNYSVHPPTKPYGSTEQPDKDMSPASYGFLAGPDPENWGEISDCVAPGTRLLTKDLRWQPIELLEPGDEIVAFDENQRPGGARGRKFRTSKVIAVKSITKPCVRITASDGTSVIASADHFWLADSGKNMRWVPSSRLREGVSSIISVGRWEEEDSKEAGWLAGMYDGEGWLSGNPESTRGKNRPIGVAQVEGPVADHLRRALKERGFRFDDYGNSCARARNPHWKDCRRMQILGGLSEQLRLLGTIRPERLVAKAERLWENRQVKSIKSALVLSVEPVGEREVIALQTEERTFIAEGWLSHNSSVTQSPGITSDSMLHQAMPSWDEVGERYPHIYGDREHHGEAAEGADGEGIGEAANFLANDRAEDPDAEGSSAHDLDFHHEWVDPKHIDYWRREHDDMRVRDAEEGYRQGGSQVPPLVLVHRHGIYQVADGSHRAQGAVQAGHNLVPAYVHYSVHEDEPFSNGTRGPFSGADPSGHHTAMTREGPDVGDWIPERQESFPYSDQANTVGPSTSSEARDPQGIRMEEALRTAMAEMLDLYHHTSPENARSIVQSGRFEPDSEREGRDPDDFDPRVYFSTRRHGEAEREHGPGAVHVRYPAGDADWEDEAGDGEEYYSVPADHLRSPHIVGEAMRRALAEIRPGCYFCGEPLDDSDIADAASAHAECEEMRSCPVHGEHDDPVTAESHRDTYTEWGDHLPWMSGMHRGLPLQLPRDVHAHVHDESRPLAERAQALARHLNAASWHGIAQEHSDDPYAEGHLGVHWTDSEPHARAWAEDDRNEGPHGGGPKPSVTHIVLHAATPQEEHLETDPDVLEERHMYGFDHPHSEREVPVRHGAPVHLTGVSWKRGGTDEWNRHDFSTPVPHVAELEDSSSWQEEIPDPGSQSELAEHLISGHGYWSPAKAKFPTESLDDFYTRLHSTRGHILHHQHARIGIEVTDRDKLWLRDMGIEGALRIAYAELGEPQLQGGLGAELKDEPDSALDPEGLTAAPQMTSIYGAQDALKLKYRSMFGRTADEGQYPLDASATGGGPGMSDDETGTGWDEPSIQTTGARYMYHSTLPANRDSIRENGLSTRFSDDPDEWAGDPGVYLSDRPNIAEPHHDIWRADTTGYHPETDALSGEDPGVVGRSWYFDHDIPAERLTLHREGTGFGSREANQQWSGGGSDSDEITAPGGGDEYGGTGGTGQKEDQILAQFQATAAARLYGGGGGGQGAADGDIAAAAKAFLSKTAHETFSADEAQALIAEGRGGARARNLDLLDIDGTHYADNQDQVEKRGLSLDDVDDDLMLI
jgi:hypothetical protein